MSKWLTLICLVVFSAVLSACSQANHVLLEADQEASGVQAISSTFVAASPLAEGIPPTPPDMFFEDYGTNLFVNAEDDPLSTFAMDVDTASYTLTRSYLTGQDQLPPLMRFAPKNSSTTSTQAMKAPKMLPLTSISTLRHHPSAMT